MPNQVSTVVNNHTLYEFIMLHESMYAVLQSVTGDSLKLILKLNKHPYKIQPSFINIAYYFAFYASHCSYVYNITLYITVLYGNKFLGIKIFMFFGDSLKLMITKILPTH